MKTFIRVKARKSLIWKISTEELKNIVKTSTSITEILSHFGLRNIGGNYKTLRNRLTEEGIDYNHIPRGIGHRHGKTFPKEQKTLEECFRDIFIKHDNNKIGKHVREYFKRFNLKPYKCEICGFEGMWNNLPLTLQMDHKNGDTSDNRIDNLRWVCPHCHTQTKTFAGRKLKIKYFCEKCGKESAGYKKLCFSCAMIDRRKVERPSKEVLEREVLEFPILQLGKKYNVEDNTVRKWCKLYGISPSPYGNGYWQKKKAGKI